MEVQLHRCSFLYLCLTLQIPLAKLEACMFISKNKTHQFYVFYIKLLGIENVMPIFTIPPRSLIYIKYIKLMGFIYIWFGKSYYD